MSDGHVEFDQLVVFPYTPARDPFLFRIAAILIGFLTVVCLGAAIWMATCHNNDISTAVLAIAATGFGSLTTFFTQHIVKKKELD